VLGLLTLVNSYNRCRFHIAILFRMSDLFIVGICDFFLDEQDVALTDVTVLARRAVSATRLPTRPAAALQTTTDDTDRRRRQTPASKTILTH